jgi:hypothetical protein
MDELFVEAVFVKVVLIGSPWTSLRPKAATLQPRRIEVLSAGELGFRT